MNERARLRAAAAKLRENEAAHDLIMTEICARGGKTLKEMQAMSRHCKDEFISEHRLPKSAQQGKYDEYSKAS